MNVIDRVKELLAAAETKGDIHVYCGEAEHQGAPSDESCDGWTHHNALRVLVRPITLALVESQKALEKVAQVECDDLIHFSLIDDPESCDPDCIRCPVEAALRMDGLAKVMKR